MRYLIQLTLASLATGCVGQVADRVTDAMIHGPNRALSIALYSYREGAGHWPSAPDALAKSRFLDMALQLDRYENLRFERMDDGRLLVSFDRYVPPDGEIVWRKTRFAVGELAEH